MNEIFCLFHCGVNKLQITHINYVFSDFVKGMVKKMGHRLRELAPAAGGSQDAGSRNLGATH